MSIATASIWVYLRGKIDFKKMFVVFATVNLGKVNSYVTVFKGEVPKLQFNNFFVHFCADLMFNLKRKQSS